MVGIDIRRCETRRHIRCTRLTSTITKFFVRAIFFMHSTSLIWHSEQSKPTNCLMNYSGKAVSCIPKWDSGIIPITNNWSYHPGIFMITIKYDVAENALKHVVHVLRGICMQVCNYWELTNVFSAYRKNTKIGILLKFVPRIRFSPNGEEKKSENNIFFFFLCFIVGIVQAVHYFTSTQVT